MHITLLLTASLIALNFAGPSLALKRTVSSAASQPIKAEAVTLEPELFESIRVRAERLETARVHKTRATPT